MELKHVVLLLQDALQVLILWRGTLEVKIGAKSIFLPVHSAAAFLTAILLVENPQLFPSFCFISFAWILLATMDYRSQLPNVWSRCRTFRGM
jgi:hypothetical protein